MTGKQSYKLILASLSPRRHELISHLNLPYEIHSEHADESTPDDWSPVQIVEELALRKAREVANKRQQSLPEIVIGADTIVVLDNRVLGKPKDENDAKTMLRLLQGNTHQVYSGIACIDLMTGKSEVNHRRTQVEMKSLTEEQILHYVASKEPLDKAGAYAIQGLGATMINGIQGCYFNVVGLPLSLLADMLAKFDIHVL